MSTLFLFAIPLLHMSGTPGTGVHNPSGPHQEDLVVTILFDNYAADERLGTGWGFAALVETGGHTILFDTGADGTILLENFRILGKDPSAVEAVVISHAHGDHTGGLDALLDLGIEPRLYLLEAFSEEIPENLTRSREVVMATPGMEIVPGVLTSGQVGTSIPEQALILEVGSGMVVLTGCAHPGAVEMVERAKTVSPHSVELVMGGWHLGSASGEDLPRILDQFRRWGVEKAAPTHCSGEAAMAFFQEAYGDDFVLLGSGRVVSFPDPPRA